jgi:hypothetical protein
LGKVEPKVYFLGLILGLILAPPFPKVEKEEKIEILFLTNTKVK